MSDLQPAAEFGELLAVSATEAAGFSTELVERAADFEPAVPEAARRKRDPQQRLPLVGLAVVLPVELAVASRGPVRRAGWCQEAESRGARETHVRLSRKAAVEVFSRAPTGQKIAGHSAPASAASMEHPAELAACC